MNRQLKRANEKSDKRREREQQRRKEQRRESRVRAVQTKRAASPKKAGGTNSSKEAQPVPGLGSSRLNGAYLILVIGVIASQALLPQRTDTFSLVIQAFFYLILSYFLVLWLYRRGVAQAPVVTVVGCLGLALAVEGLKFLLPQLGVPQLPAPVGSSSAPNLLFAALAVPGLLLGTWLGRYIFRRS